MSLNLDHLKQIAQRAPQSEWESYTIPGQTARHMGKVLVGIGDEEVEVIAPEGGSLRAFHIATFDPPTVQALITHIEKLETTNAHQAKVVEHYTARSESLKATLAMIADRVDDFVYDELASDIEDVALNEWGETYESDKKRLETAIQRVRELHPREVIAVHEVGEEAWCPTCQQHYPCPTIQALEES